jgi:multicomponent Na+:H+ antiporter subunit E
MKSSLGSVVARALFYFAIWVILMPSVKLDDLAVGVVATIAATWASLKLLPLSGGRVRAGALLGYLLHFLWQSILSGWDIARRAFDPRLPLRPGFVSYPTALPPGRARNEFTSITSLLPGSLSVADEPGAIVYHCLDTAQPVTEQLAAEERALARVFVAGERNA